MKIKVPLFTFIALLFFQFTALNAQNIGLDSILTVYNTTQDQTKMPIGIELLNEYFYQGYLEKGEQFGSLLLKEARKQEDKILEATILNRIGTIYHLQGKEETALPIFIQALNISKERNDKKGEGIALNNMGNMYRNLGYDAKAFTYYFESLKVCEEIADKEGIGYAYKNLALLYEGQKWWDKALFYHLKAMEIRKSSKNERLYGSAMLNAGYACIQLNKYNVALKYLIDALIIAQKGNYTYESDILLELGNVYQHFGQIQKAEKYFNQAKETSLQKKRYKVAIDATNNTIKNKIKLGDFTTTQLLVKELNILIDSGGNTNDKIKYAHIRYMLDSALNNEYAALKWFKKKSELQNSSYENKYTEDLVQKRIALDLIEKENTMQLEKINQQSFQMILYGIIFFAFVVIIAFALFFTQKTRINKKLMTQKKEIENKNHELTTINDKLFDTNNQLEEANNLIAQQSEILENKNKSLETEVGLRTQKLLEYTQQMEQYSFMTAHNLRGSVARILGLGSILKLENIEQDQREDIINKLHLETLSLDQVIKDLNQLIEVKNTQSLKIESVDLNTIVLKSKLLLIHEIDESQAKVEVNFNENPLVKANPQYLESIFYNLLSNSVKYKDEIRPLVIKIENEINNNEMAISFEDNGIGIDLKKNNDKIFSMYARFHSHVYGKGLGLYLVKTQIEAMGGTIEVASRVNEGTKFTMRLPCA